MLFQCNKLLFIKESVKVVVQQHNCEIKID